MERNVNEEEDSDTDDCGLLPKSIIKQGSTEVLNDAIDKDKSKCNHFSIRAYVAEIRRKDWKICCPFHSFGDDDEPNDQAGMLSPLPFPEFRQCFCQNCLRSSDASDDTEDITAVPNSCAEKFCEGQEASFKTTKDMDSYGYTPLKDLIRREKFVNLISKVRHDVFASGEYENKLARTVDEEISEPTFCEMKDAQYLNEEIVVKDAETTSLDFGGSRLDGPGNADCGSIDIDEFEHGNKNSSCSAEICQKEGHVDKASNIDKMGESGRDLITCAQKPESKSVEDEVSHSRADVIHDQDHSIRNMKCRKPQKVRLLADILKSEISGASSGLSGSSEIVHAETADESDDFTLDTLARSHKAVQANISNSTIYKKKRKRLQVEDPGPCHMRSSKTGSEDSQFHNSNGEKNCIKSVINHSASVNNAFATENSDADFKSLSEETRIDELVFKRKKRRKKSSIEVIQSSSKTWQENLHQELQLMSRDVENKETGIGTVPFNLANDGPTEMGFNPPKNYLGGQNCDQKCTFGMKGSSDKDSLMPPHKGVPTEEQVTVSKDVEICSYIAASYSGRDAACCMRNEMDSKRQKDSSSPFNHGNNIDAQAHLKVAKDQSSERVNKVCDLEALDDIHMEIVKLLADNRRERRLLEAEHRSTSAHDVNNAHHFPEAKGSFPFSYSQENRSNGNQFAEAGSNPKFATSSHKNQSRKLDVKISNKIDTETPCACVQKKIGKCPKPAGPSNIFSSSRASFDTGKTMVFSKEFSLPQNSYCEETSSVIDGINRVSDAYALPFSAELGTKFTIGKAVEHFPSVKRDSESCKVAKSKNSNAPVKATNNGLPSRNKSLWKNHQSYSINSLDKGFSCAPNAMVFPLDSHLVKNGTFHIEMNKKAGIARAVKGSCRSEICAINRNPADFSIPGAGNKFMRRGGDFKRRVKKFKKG